jgi:hypothetical protein
MNENGSGVGVVYDLRLRAQQIAVLDNAVVRDGLADHRDAQLSRRLILRRRQRPVNESRLRQNLGSLSLAEPRQPPASRQTYRDTARLFQERLGLFVAPSTLHSFVKVRAKHRKRSQFELPPMELASTEISPVLDHVATLKAKPTVRFPISVQLGFAEYRPSNVPFPLG